MDVNLKNVYLNYNPNLSSSRNVINNISISINNGEFVLICGRNGSGKTTLAQLITGLIRPTKGSVFFNGEDAFAHSGRALKKRIGMIFQTPEEQLFERTVYEDVSFVLQRDGGLSQSDIAARVKETLSLVGLDYEEYKDRLSFNLSSGERRKAAIACVLVNAPELIVFDEPTVGLDYTARKSLIKVIKRLHSAGKTIICISHNIENFLDFSDTVLIIKEGEIVFSGAGDRLLDNFDMVKDEIRFPDVFTIIHGLEGVRGGLNGNIYSKDDALTFLKGIIK